MLSARITGFDFLKGKNKFFLSNSFGRYQAWSKQPVISDVSSFKKKNPLKNFLLDKVRSHGNVGINSLGTAVGMIQEAEIHVGILSLIYVNPSSPSPLFD